jgi:hypothetical protein
MENKISKGFIAADVVVINSRSIYVANLRHIGGRRCHYLYQQHGTYHEFNFVLL